MKSFSYQKRTCFLERTIRNTIGVMNNVKIYERIILYNLGLSILEEIEKVRYPSIVKKENNADLDDITRYRA